MVKPVCVKPQEPNNSMSTPEHAATATAATAATAVAVRTLARLVQARFNVLGFLGTFDLRAYLSTSREAKSTKTENTQAHNEVMLAAIVSEVLQVGYSGLASQELNEIASHVTGINLALKTNEQKTELFHQVLSHWEGIPSTEESVGNAALRLCDQLFPPDLTESGFPIRQLDTLPNSRQPRVANYSRFGGFKGDAEVQTRETIQHAVLNKVHVLFA